MTTIYVDIDDTVKDTERYIREVYKRNGYRGLPKKTIYSWCNTPKDSIIKDVMCNHSVIPYRVGAKECLKLLRTEYKLVFYSHYTYEQEKDEKFLLSKEWGIPIILEQYADSKDLDMSGSYIVDDRNEVLYSCNADRKFEMYSPYMFNSVLERDDRTTIVDWYSLVSILIGDEVDEGLRKYISSRIPQLNEAGRQQGYILNTSARCM